METRPRTVDPRVKRTRRLLQQVFIELLREKSFHAITVQDIAERATINRATFYAHFEDKYALLDTYILEGFQNRVASRLPPPSSLNAKTLRLLVFTVLEYLALIHSGCRPNDRQIEPRFEATVQQELQRILLDWFKKLPPSVLQRRVSIETLVSTISWAIFGAGVQWNYDERACTVQEMTDQIMTVISEGLFHLVQIPHEG